MREVDPTAYRCGFCDWLDSIETVRCSVCGEEFEPDQDMITIDDYVECPDCQAARKG
jgi:DNA-directed RNA polymerase subunit RPC12/RpoP